MTRKPDETTAGNDDEAFLSRWSRKKREAQQPLPPVAEKSLDPKAPAPELPPVDKLSIESDFRAFFHPKVGEDVRRAALKKLFSDPHFNLMDGLDVYIDDYSKSEPIPAAMLAGLRQAQNILAWAKEDEEKRAQERSLPETQARALEPPAAQSPSGASLEPSRPDAASAPTEDAGTRAKS